MSFYLVKSTVFAALFSVGAASADTHLSTLSPEPVAAHYGQCADTTDFVSAHCAALRRANLDRLRDCMAAAPATSQGYRARYLLCQAEVNRTQDRNGG